MGKKRVKGELLSHEDLAMAMLDPDSEYFDEEQYAMWGHLHPSYEPDEFNEYGLLSDSGCPDEVGFRD
jgi:hypothetical protein